ncbi:MAG: tetratricopeptide repeat protein [Acidobacteriia bacterium]|nr:tetratricopeptide repeat protein [Terriglobia bacterium]
MRSLSVILALAFFFVSAGFCQEEHQHALTEEEVGSVHFATSCRADLGGSFNRAVALLHSFQYEQAREAFAEVASQEPQCAMAQWGVAMSHYHGMWNSGDLAAGRAALYQARQIAAKNTKTTTRETAYIEALAEIYREDDEGKVVHAQAFEQKMGALQAAYPHDDEAAIFHALTLAITAPKTDKTFSNQRKCGEILEPIFEKQLHHPGIAHYIIHCYDNPVLAERGLGAARMYAKIAPASAHANHMPSHLFTRVGSWDESISSNLKSAELAAAAEGNSKNGEARDQRLHAMDYLEYAYLQSGRVTQAKAVWSEMNSLQAIPGLTLVGDYALAAIPARYTIELGNWEQASQLRVREGGVPWAEAITWAAIGIGSARSKNVERAGQAEAKLAALRDVTAKQGNSYWSNQVEVERRELAAWITEQNGKPDDALQLARSAAELEESMDKDAITPGAVTPAREVLAELLLREHHPKDALAEYENVLKIAPNRFNALYGAASAAEASGDVSAATRYFQKLTEVAVGDERPELKAAREKLMAERAAK